MTLAIIRWIKANKSGLFIGGTMGFLISKFFFGEGGGSRQALGDLSAHVGLIDSWLPYDPPTILFVKATIILVFFFAIIGGITDSLKK